MTFRLGSSWAPETPFWLIFFTVSRRQQNCLLFLFFRIHLLTGNSQSDVTDQRSKSNSQWGKWRQKLPNCDGSSVIVCFTNSGKYFLPRSGMNLPVFLSSPPACLQYGVVLPRVLRVVSFQQAAAHGGAGTSELCHVEVREAQLGVKGEFGQG